MLGFPFLSSETGRDARVPDRGDARERAEVFSGHAGQDQVRDVGEVHVPAEPNQVESLLMEEVSGVVKDSVLEQELANGVGVVIGQIRGSARK